jgi:regulator of sigma E protease
MMFVSLFYLILAILGLSFLIFIHELGHYWMARRVGMKVETFSIGFGKPIFSWMRDGVKWQIGWLPFGGFVKIAGMENEADPTISPYDIPDGFYGKTPWQRIKVAFMGPFVNLLFAFLLFGLLWSLGGRDKNFSDVTSKIGWVDPKSELYASGIRPGDEVTAYDDHPFKGLKDHFYAAITGVGDVAIHGNKAAGIDTEIKPFEVKVKGYQNPLSII